MLSVTPICGLNSNIETNPLCLNLDFYHLVMCRQFFCITNCLQYLHGPTCTYLLSTWTYHVSTYLYLPTCTPTYLPTCTPTHLPSHISTYIYTYLPTCTPTYVYIYLHAHLPTCIPTYPHVYLHTYSTYLYVTAYLLPTYLTTYLPNYLPTYM